MLLSQGAEAVRRPENEGRRIARKRLRAHIFPCPYLKPAQRLYTTVFLGRPAVVKERFKKEYRLAVLDEKITKERLAAVRVGPDNPPLPPSPPIPFLTPPVLVFPRRRPAASPGAGAPASTRPSSTSWTFPAPAS